MDWLQISGKSIDAGRLKELLGSLGEVADLVEKLPEALHREFERVRQAVVQSDVLATAEELKDQLSSTANLADLVAVLALEDELWDSVDALIAAVENAGLDTDGLREAAGKARQILGTVPDKYYRLLRHVDTFAEKAPGENPGLVDWTLDHSLDSADTVSSGLALDMAAAGTGALQFEAGHLFPWPAADSRYLRIGVRGSLDTRFSGELPLRLGSLALGAGGTSEVRANFMSARATESGTFAREATAALGNLVNPLDLESLFNAMTDGKIAGMTIAAVGEAHMNSSVSLAAAGDVAKLVDLGAALTVDAELRIGGSYSVNARPGDDGSIVVEVSAASSRSSSIGTTLGVTLNASQLAAHLKTQFEPYVADFREHFGRVEALLQPGALLRSQLRSRIDDLFDDEVFRSAAQLAIGGASDTKVKQLLADRLQNFLDTQAVVWEEKSATAARTGMAWITNRYPSLADSKLQDKLTGVLEEALKSLHEKVRSEVGKLPAGKLDRLTEALARSGIRVQEGTDRLDRATEGVLRALGNHATRVQVFLSKAEELATSDLQLQFASRRSTAVGRSLLASAVVHSTSKAASRAYRSLLAGDLDALASLIDKPVAGFELTLKGWQRFAQFKQMQGFSMVIFDVELSSRTVFSNKATVSRDQSGALSVLATTDWKRRRKAFRDEQSYLFTSVYSLVAARLTQSFTASLTITHADERASSAELEQFLRRLEKHGLTAPSTTESALTHVPEQDLQAAVSVDMQLDHHALLRLLFLHEHSERFTKETVARHALIALRKSGSLSDSEYTLGIRAIRSAYLGIEEGMTPEEVVLRFKPGSGRHLVFSRYAGAENTTKALRVWEDVYDKIRALLKMLSAMRKVMREDPIAANTSKKNLEKWYRDRQKPIDDALKKWLVIDGTLVNWVSERISDDTMAFLLLIDQLTASTDTGGYALQAYLELDGEKRIALPSPAAR